MSKCSAFHFKACVQTPLPSVKIDFKGEVGASIHRLFTLLIVHVFILFCKVGGEEGGWHALMLFLGLLLNQAFS